MEKPAKTAYPIHDPLARRWSPIAFESRAVETEKLGSLLEAARWAPSSYNEQPWAFFVGTRADSEVYERLERCLVPANREWTFRAPVLMLSVAKKAFDRNKKPNRHAWHDVGLATACMMIQAVALGLAMHAMAGFDPDRAREELAIPEGWDPVAMIATGYQADPSTLAGAQRERELAPRTRKELSSFVFGAAWGSPLKGL